MGDIGSARAFAVDSYPAGMLGDGFGSVCKRAAVEVAEERPGETWMLQGHLDKVMRALRGDCNLWRRAVGRDVRKWKFHAQT